jgi:hypothetical protein
MVSATVDETICNYYFGADKVKFHECPLAQYEGTLEQYYDNTMSRGFITRNPDVFNWIKDFSGFKHTISFKKFLLKGLYDGELSYGNTAGCDYLKGQNINVVGTYHLSEWIYKLFALSLGFDTNTKLKHGVTVTHNGYRFKFTTFDDKPLRDIQFYMIETELEQAVGRARLLREPCAVYLFSNFPLRQAVMRVSGYKGKDDKDVA